MAQTRTSKNTSMNGKQGKLPRLYNKVVFPKGGTVVDYGCGNGTELLEKKALKDGCSWYGYDLYWKPDQTTLDVLEKGVDLSVCCNLLNVIDDDETLKEIVSKLIDNSKQVVFQVYTRDGDNIGKPTGDDDWQRNNTTEWYKEFIESLGYKVTKALKSGFIYCDGCLTDLN